MLLDALAHITDNQIIMHTDLASLPLRYADNKQKQVLFNIFINASEASRHGVVITLDLNSEVNTGSIRIADTGLGIPKEIITISARLSLRPNRRATGLGYYQQQGNYS